MPHRRRRNSQRKELNTTSSPSAPAALPADANTTSLPLPLTKLLGYIRKYRHTELQKLCTTWGGDEFAEFNGPYHLTEEAWRGCYADGPRCGPIMVSNIQALFATTPHAKKEAATVDTSDAATVAKTKKRRGRKAKLVVVAAEENNGDTAATSTPTSKVAKGKKGVKSKHSKVEFGVVADPPACTKAIDPATQLTTLLHTHILSLFPTARHHSYVCSAGFKGYHAVKEMLQNGKPGNTLLIESDGFPNTKDDDAKAEHMCSLITDNKRTRAAFWKNIPAAVTAITLFGNVTTLPNILGLPAKPGPHSRLTSINVTPLSQVVAIPPFFLAGCSGLTTLDVAPLSNVSTLPHGFLLRCSGLHSINLELLPPSSVAPSEFLTGCSSLTTINLSSFTNQTKIELSFLHGCSSLSTLDLSPLSRVTVIEHRFLQGCCSLTSIDLSPFSQVTEVGELFLSGCSGLLSLDLKPLSNLTRIVGGHFVERCSSLTSLDLTPLSQLTVIGSAFLGECKGLKSIDLSPLSGVTEVDPFFLYECSGLTSIDLSPLSQIKERPHRFLHGCSGLKNVDMSPLPPE